MVRGGSSPLGRTGKALHSGRLVLCPLAHPRARWRSSQTPATSALANTASYRYASLCSREERGDLRSLPSRKHPALLDGANPLRSELLVAAEEPAPLLRKRKPRRRRRRQMNRRLRSWGLFGIGRGHVRSLACQADRPEDDFGRQKHAADAEPV